jgi:hypothetical protein
MALTAIKFTADQRIKFHQNRSINNGHYGQKYFVYALNMVRTSLTRFSWNSRLLNNVLLWTSEWESLLIFGEEFRLWRSSLRSLLHSPVTPSLLGASPQSMFLPQFRHQVTTPIKNGRQLYKSLYSWTASWETKDSGLKGSKHSLSSLSPEVIGGAVLICLACPLIF